MTPFYCGLGFWWFLPLIGVIIFMMLACFLFRRIFRSGAFCCPGGAGAQRERSRARSTSCGTRAPDIRDEVTFPRPGQ
jgi:hypothetical protein